MSQFSVKEYLKLKWSHDQPLLIYVMLLKICFSFPNINANIIDIF